MTHRPSLGTDHVAVRFSEAPPQWGWRAAWWGSGALILALGLAAAMSEHLRALRTPLAEAALTERLLEVAAP